ncbi:MAG: hypothetical protein LBS59_06305 [Puniceicoccales bacterium]|jgi:hypothetical protein|nr:hypothetical protein [Puniceicoccales bacterium]
MSEDRIEHLRKIGLQHSRQFILPVAEAQPRDDETAFELVTWLVLQAAPSSPSPQQNRP